ncbi:MAG: methyltransferase domain-containing protein [Lactobacillales bacterium]|jgi:ubiquinone/menaquinone biosynthesis C-methylase UbiE|nr:methyltransferase domain-containing protein [Lactobacillales bacterium]
MKDYISLSRTHYNKIANKFDKSLDGLFSFPFKKTIVEELNLTPSEVVLDVGCANGKLLSMLSEKNPKFIGAGIDLSDEMIKMAESRYPEFSFVQGNAEHLPFDSGTFDQIICSASFHHFPHPEEFLKEAYRVLKPGGKLLIAEIHIPSLVLPFYNFYIDKFNKEGDVKVYRPKEIRQLMNEAGFKVNPKTKLKLQIQLNWGKKR